ncbi:hypothetical protein M8R20_00290 [Pseudomonas sp. R2.Fl]|nr:hypothetical protein [Pseudomonas sp. R2.Fl]
MIDFLWLLAVAGGPLLLAAAFVYAIFRQRRLSSGERRRQHVAENELYHREDRPR